MGQNTFKIAFEDGTTKSVSIDVIDVEFTKGYWTSDKEGKTKIERDNLENTVYYHIETKGVKEGTKINFELREADFFFDDEKFEGKKVALDGIVKNKNIILELKLDPSWEQDLVDDGLSNIEIYWDWNNNGKAYNSRDNQLTVYFSKRTLYFNMPLNNYNLPDLRSSDGSPLVYLKFMGGMAKGKIKGKALDAANKKIKESIHKIALGKLEKGSLATSTGRIQTNSNAQIYAKDTYSNDGTLIKNLKKRRNWGNATETTSAISQYDFFTKTGKRVKVLGFLKDVTFNKKVNFLDILSLSSYTTDSNNPFDEPLPDFGIGAFSRVAGSFALVWTVAGIMVAQMKAESDALMREIDQERINTAKLKGLSAVRSEINIWNHNKDYEWFLMSVSVETANKLLAGEFKTFKDFEDFSFESIDNQDVEILYRRITNSNTDAFNYIIETVFINE